MGSQFDRIIYSHPAKQDGFDYFYIAYRPGVEGVSIKYRRTAEDARQSTMRVEDLLEFLNVKRQQPTEQWPLPVVDRAARLLNTQVERWNSRDSGKRR